MQDGQDVDIGWCEDIGLQTGMSVLPTRPRIGEDGRCWEDICRDLIAFKTSDHDWRGGKVPIYVYYDSEELLGVSRDAYNLYFSENALGRRAFPSIVRMESDVIGMALSLFKAPEGAVGSFTSGGTESIFLALKAARDHFRVSHPREQRPRIVIPRTAHPAFDKAAHYLDCDVVRTKTTTDLRADADDLAAAIDTRTMLIAGSAPCYPYGVFDPIAKFGQIATSHGVWFHVDACLGGFLAPFAREEGYCVPEFEFSVPGVTSLSADLHKHGFCAKGASVVLYGSRALHARQRFHFDNWPRGTYSTETFLGSRPGGAVASAWAVLQFLGRIGFRRLARKTMGAKDRLVTGIEEISGLEVVRPSDLSIVLYKSSDKAVEINAVAESMREKGWFVGRSREPDAIHLALNPVHTRMIDEYVMDLKGAVDNVRSSGRLGEHDDHTY